MSWSTLWESGFSIIGYGRNAFNVRVAMADAAEKTLDLQVYRWEVDETGRILAERLIRAAERRVRVRLLVDDMGTLPLQAPDGILPQVILLNQNQE